MKVKDIVDGMAPAIAARYREERDVGTPHQEVWSRSVAAFMEALNTVEMLVQMEATRILETEFDLQTGERQPDSDPAREGESDAR